MIDNETLGRQILELGKSDQDFRNLFSKLNPNKLAEELLHHALVGAAFSSNPIKMIVGMCKMRNIEIEDIQAAFEDAAYHGYDVEKNS